MFLSTLVVYDSDFETKGKKKLESRMKLNHNIHSRMFV